MTFSTPVLNHNLWKKGFSRLFFTVSFLMQSNLFNTDTKCLLHRGVRIIELGNVWFLAFMGPHELSVIERCPYYRGVRKERLDCMTNCVWLAFFLTYYVTLFSPWMYIDIYSKLCILYPGLDFVNRLKKPEARNVCIKQQDMGLAKISTILLLGNLKQ